MSLMHSINVNAQYSANLNLINSHLFDHLSNVYHSSFYSLKLNHSHFDFELILTEELFFALISGVFQKVIDLYNLSFYFSINFRLFELL